MSKFEETFNELRMEQEDLDERMAKVRAEAIDHVQEIINQFGLSINDFSFFDSEAPVKKQRKPARVKYRLPNGVEWSGKGQMKKEVKEYLDQNGLVKEDLDQFLVN